MHVKLVRVLKLGMPSTFTQHFRTTSIFRKTCQGAMSEQMSMGINTCFGFEPLEEIIHICIFQGVSSSRPPELDEEVIGLYFISMNENQVVEDFINEILR